MSIHWIDRVIKAGDHITGSRKAVLMAIASCVDHGGCNAFACQSTLAQWAGVSVRTVGRVLKSLKQDEIITCTGGRKSRRGKAVCVYRINGDCLLRPKSDRATDRPVKQLQKQKARQEKIGREAAFRILAGQYGWATLQEWSAEAIERAIGRIVGSDRALHA